MTLTQEKLRNAVDYDRETGIFRWRRRDELSVQWNARYAGHVAGGINGAGYREIAIDGRKYLEHRLAWLFSHGRWPSRQIDHVDGNPTNNRLANLREATVQQNAQNRRAPKNSQSGHIGVSWQPRRSKWRAQIRLEGRNITIGRFKTFEEARQAYLDYRAGSIIFQPVPRQATTGEARNARQQGN